MTFDMNRIWSQAVAMVRADWQNLALIAGIFFLLPNLIVVVALPDLMGQLQVPPTNADELIARLTPLLPTLLTIGVVTMLLSIFGYAAMIRLLAHDRPSMGEAMRAAIGALPMLLGCVLVAFAGYMVFALVGGMAVALVALGLGLLIGPEAASLVGIILLVLVLAWLAVRFTLVTAVVMLEGVSSPLAAFTRSWQLTKSSHRRLCAFLALLLLPYLVVSGLISNVAGLTGNLFFSALVSGLLSVAFTMLLTAIIVAMHQQLSGAAQASAEAFK